MILSVCWTCQNTTGFPSAHLNHKHLSCHVMELLEFGVSPSREHQQSCLCFESVRTPMFPTLLNCTRLHFATGLFCGFLGCWAVLAQRVVHRRGKNCHVSFFLEQSNDDRLIFKLHTTLNEPARTSLPSGVARHREESNEEANARLQDIDSMRIPRTPKDATWEPCHERAACLQSQDD